MFKKTPMFQKTIIATVFVAATSLMPITASWATDRSNYAKMTPEALAEYLVFQSGSYDLEQYTQDKNYGRDRLIQDDIQKICSQVALSGKAIDANTAAKVNALAKASLMYPSSKMFDWPLSKTYSAGDLKLGDWKKGRDIAWSGFGWRTAHAPDNHTANTPAGGNCYNCHALATDRTGGTLGPSLTGYGKMRGNSPEVLKYTYETIYNAHVTYACTSMPRLGAKGVIDQQSIADVMAYLLDPASPVNK